ncbi:hypothetical protein COW36_17630 [bacterium (Candidatus Blackallbacteria) CG17_big_fil_post_rev_8_21_14_2_50_48_46]|uniref:DUF4019 domain-containing protein n=1 Tax=bacterium (Candidatus Blackallbacteria) CG17_big_fil_post_rev_8_21_14_2_50_48_46 TaxID=2014261 RepID=A0A2M7G1N1_9BACT|nr:MAG: hypothetical protein COW64_01095 [bacterium (Candidatus Blackallbacteria) CG18_big_fil_WC_8_21_14_2_50_49_26]PIW15240.1 MAG: hypothetical protein COW36_17630 [bacterium (Candidatus Blackallbacteria) CG17_big_fil_post_rev_8_21_14_2_50_48_46]PIW45251.1 MAG: hypothetical protein COW20_21385 [bacterium (Candidatus Blackallbacteria) CG13_big_fil_rev_8_21_14_2_50_49_14]
MKPVLLSLACFGLLNFLPAQAAAPDGVEKAKLAAQHWLALTDRQQYAQSWQQAAGFFKASIPQSTWVKALKTNRAPLGRLKSRQLKFSAFTKTLPKAPKGNYVLLHYRSVFERQANVTETVTTLLDKGGVWRVAGYSIQR